MTRKWKAILMADSGEMSSLYMCELLGRTVIEYVKLAAEEAGAEEVCVLNEMDQEDLKEWDGDVVVMSANIPLVQPKEIAELVEVHQEHGNAVTYYMPKAGTMTQVMSQDKGFCFCFRANYLSDALEAMSRYAATNVLNRVISDGGRAEQRIKPECGVFDVVCNRVQLAKVLKKLQQRINEAHMMAGVVMMSPENTYIAPGVEIGADTLIYPGTYLEGNTKIGEGCVIGPNSRIVSSQIGNGTEVAYSTVLQSSIGQNTHVGPYAYVRPNSQIGDDVKVGDFVEVKNAKIGNGTKMSHLTYVGDADVGERINFGCGTVVVNYDGVHKFRTVIEDDAFIGCNTNLVSPVHVEKGAFIAAGSTITENVPENALAIARARQVNKEGWISPKKKAGK